MRLRGVLVFGMACAAIGCGDNLPPPCGGWTQWGGDGAHTGVACVAGQPLEEELARVEFDPFTPFELADAEDRLIIHYQVPLLVDDEVFMVGKSGTYTPCSQPDCEADLYRRHSQVWNEVAYRWIDGALVERWRFPSDWKPVPGIEFEPMFQPAVSGDVVVVPGAGGAIWELDRATGAVRRHHQPFGSTVDPDHYVTSGIAVGPDGALYYNAIALDHDQPWTSDAQGWLVVVAPDGAIRTVDYATVMPLAADAMCYGAFTSATTPRPWPPPPLPDGSPALPPLGPCGSQRAGINTTPAIGPDGTIFVVTRAQLADRYSFVAALAPDLQPRWTASLRDRLADGCGVTIPSDGTETENLDHCRAGALHGVDPATNQAPAGRVNDWSSSSPVALPDGGVLYGSASVYNQQRGHTMLFAPDGSLRATYDFGWDTTPAVVPTGAGYEVMMKDNTYAQDESGATLGPFLLARLTSGLARRWTFRNTETMSCFTDAQGNRVCVEDHPNGFEWCINALAVDGEGVTYANAEDGHVYAIGPDGELRGRLFLDRSLGAAYTPLAIDREGRIYALNNGRMTVIGAR